MDGSGGFADGVRSSVSLKNKFKLFFFKKIILLQKVLQPGEGVRELEGGTGKQTYDSVFIKNATYKHTFTGSVHPPP